jgi:hypothetical protein
MPTKMFRHRCHPQTLPPNRGEQRLKYETRAAKIANRVGACSSKVMPLIKFTDDQIVKRLRWAMIAVMLFSLFNTLAGQPRSFWHHPETAIRGDGLSIHNETNHTFEFF